MTGTHEREGSGPTGAALASIIAARFGGNLLIRFPYTFLTTLSRAFGIPLDTMTTLLGARELGGLVSPAIGRVADRGHERSTMVGAAAVAGVATIAVSADPPLWVVSVLLIGGGIAKFGLDTSQGAWVAHRVPLARRGRIFGIVELSWALALLVGVPICGALVETWGWRSMFRFSGALLIATAVLMRISVRPDRPERSDTPRRPRFRRELAGVWLYSALQPFAQMFVFAVYGDWFATTLRMSPARLSLMSILIGLGELGGTGLSALFADRVGKRRAALGGILLAAPVVATLGFVGTHELLAVTLMVVVAVGLEFSFVSALPLIAELDPAARASAIGLAIALGTGARAASAALGGVVYVSAGIGATGAITAVTCCLGAAALWTVTPDSAPRHR